MESDHSAARISKQDSPQTAWISRAEWAVALVLLVLGVWLRIEFVSHAGGLWRDEAGSAGLATLPTAAEVVANLEHESFPIVWPFVLRAVASVSGGSDAAFRGLGLATSIAALAGVGLLAWSIHRRAPLFVLTLLGLNLTLVQWGSAIRGHGAGALTGALAVIAFLRLAATSRLSGVVFAATTACLAVQTSYYNAVIVLAAGAGIAAVAWLRRDIRLGVCGMGAGALSALSLLPYVGVFRRGAEWRAIVAVPSYDLAQFLSQAEKVLVGSRASALWVGLILVALAWGGSHVWRRGSDLPARQREVVVFALVTLVAAVVGYFGFLQALRYPTQVWYYLALLVPVGLCIDLALNTLARNAFSRAALMLAVLAAARLIFPFARAAAPMRLTNIDLAAREVATRATARDFVLVSPWFLAVSYSRYHTAAADWTSVPPLASSRTHRYDLVREEMSKPDQTAPTARVRDRIRETLLAGGNVYLIGEWPPSTPIGHLPAAPGSASGWQGEPYFRLWHSQVADALATHAGTIEVISLPTDVPVCPYENATLVVAEGLRE